MKQVTYDSYIVDEYSELIQNLKDISNIQQCSFRLMLCYPHFGHLSFQVLFTFFNLKMSWKIVSSRNFFTSTCNS